MSFFRCPTCARGTQSLTLDTRTLATAEVIRRRRECSVCRTRYSTIEVLDEAGLATSAAAPRSVSA